MRGIVSLGDVRFRGVELPPYDPDARCPKCRHDEISTSHVARGCDRDDCSVCDAEHLLRNCRRCHFQWAEAVAS